MSRDLAILSLAIFLLAITISDSIAKETYPELGLEREQYSGTVVITIHGFRSNEGVVWFNLFDNPKGYPGGKEVAKVHCGCTIRNHTASLTIDNLAPGIYAFNFIHDEDGNERLNRNLVGLPVEGFGFSNNLDPRKKFSLPGFKDAAFETKPGLNSIAVDVLY